MKDIATDVDGDLLIKNGDIVLADESQNHIKLLMITNPGDWRHDPTLGAGLFKFVSSGNKIKNKDGAASSIRLQLQKDEWVVKGIKVSSLEDIQIDAEKL